MINGLVNDILVQSLDAWRNKDGLALSFNIMLIGVAGKMLWRVERSDYPESTVGDIFTSGSRLILNDVICAKYRN